MDTSFVSFGTARIMRMKRTLRTDWISVNSNSPVEKNISKACTRSTTSYVEVLCAIQWTRGREKPPLPTSAGAQGPGRRLSLSSFKMSSTEEPTIRRAMYLRYLQHTCRINGTVCWRQRMLMEVHLETAKGRETTSIPPSPSTMPSKLPLTPDTTTMCLWDRS